jgi:hypothetical protein
MLNTQNRPHRHLVALLVVLLCNSFAVCADWPVHIVDVHVDKGRPLAGERSRMARGSDGQIRFVYTLVAGEHSCQPIGVIDRAGRIQLDAIHSETTWNVEGWGTNGQPFDILVDKNSELHFAARHHGQPYGVDYWYRADGQWKMETFGAGVTFGGNNVAMGLLPNGQSVVVCLARDRTRLTVWNRDLNGKWKATNPDILRGVSPGQFDLSVDSDGELNIVACRTDGTPVCWSGSGDAEEPWRLSQLADCKASQMIECIEVDGKLRVVFAGGPSTSGIRNVYLATRKNKKWSIRIIATCPADQHIARTSIDALNDTIVVAWEQGIGRTFSSKDYGARVGQVGLTVIQGESEPETQIIAESAGRPSVVLSAEAKQGSLTAWVGLYTGNEHGDDFRLAAVSIGDKAIKPVMALYDPAALVSRACLNEIRSGNNAAARRGFERIDMRQLDAETRRALIDQFLDSDQPGIRMHVARELARANDVLLNEGKRNEMIARIRKISADPNPLVPQTFLTHLTVPLPAPKWLLKEVERALVSGQPTNRLIAADWLRRNTETNSLAEVDPSVFRELAMSADAERSSDVGSAFMALEQFGATDNLLEMLRADVGNSFTLQANKSLLQHRLGQEVDITSAIGLFDIQKEQSIDSWVAQLTYCGLAGQMRSAKNVPLLKRALSSRHFDVRQAAMYALRSTAMTAQLKAVAKHPKGIDLLALRFVESKLESEVEAREAAVGVLVEALAHDDPNVRKLACDTLSRVRATNSVDAIARLVDDKDKGVQIAAQTAISVLRNRYDQALIDLGAWKRDQSKRVARQLNGVARLPTRDVNGVILAGTDKHLFLDDFVIQSTKGLKRRLHPFKKHPRNPVFQAQVPWEEGWTDPFMSTVMYDADERCFKLWYRCGPRHSLKGYAVSEDGVHWQRPNVSREPWGEYKDHNLIGFDGKIAIWKKPGNNVIYRPDLDASKRYQSLFYEHDKKYYVSDSPDGVNWAQPHPVQQAYGDVVSLVWDKSREKYLFFPKYMRQVDGFVRRSFAAVELDELTSQASRVFPFVATRREDAIAAQGASRAFGSLLADTLKPNEFHSEIYSVTAMPYEGYVVALYDLWTVIGTREGPLDMLMKVSRDMKTWTDVDFPRRALPIGRFGQWDSGMVYGGNTMLVVDDEIRLYYLGANMGHCTKTLPMTKPYHAIGMGLATLRLDGFASMRADSKGELVTKPLQMTGSKLVVNASCPKGVLRVELLDAKGTPIPGFTTDDCDGFIGDSIRQTVSWKGSTNVAALRDQPIHIRFTMDSGDLYSFQFKD